MKRTFLLMCVPLVLAAGCARVPFNETPLVSLETEDPGRVVERFRAHLPESFQLLNSVVFDYNWLKFSGIGTIEVDRAKGTFKVAGMNPMGVKLFELSGDQDSIAAGYSIAALNTYGDIATAVGSDIRRMYFDLAPGPEAKGWKKKYKIIFRQPSNRGFMEYVFAGAGGELIEKNYYEDSGIVWRISYYEYGDQNGYRLPRGIVFIHYDYGYRLTVRHKEFRFE